MFASAVEAVRTLTSQARRREPPAAFFEQQERLHPPACPICDSPMVVREATRIDETGVSNVSLHAMRCDTCGMILDRLYHPSTGYDVDIAI